MKIFYLKKEKTKLCCAIVCAAITVAACVMSVSAEEAADIQQDNYISEADALPADGWVTDENGKSYYILNGEKLTGLCEVDESTYFFAPNGAMKNGWFTIDGIRMFFDLETGKKRDGWIEYMGDTFYADKELGKLIGAYNIDGETYIFNEYGALQTGWFEYDGSKYYGTENGILKGDQVIDGVDYYFSPEGRFQSGWQTSKDGLRVYYDYETAAPKYGWIHHNGLVYYADEENGKYTGEHDIDGVKYRFSDRGYMKTGFQTFDDGTRYYYEDGTAAVGIVEADDGYIYYFGEDYLMRTGFTDIGGKTYYFDPIGRMLFNWQTIDDNRYYFGDDGAMRIGLQEISGKTYYFDKSGVMQTGWQTIDKKKYYFGKDGVMQTGFQTIDGKKYYFADDGVMQTGWQTIGDKKYYFNKDGVMQTGFQTIDGKKYYFGSDGIMCIGWNDIDKKRYYFNSDGIMQTGLKTIDGKKYYLGDSGAMQTGWQTISGDKYYFDKTNGNALTGINKVDGKKYHFDRSSGILVCSKTLNGITTNSSGIVTEVLLDTPYISQSGYPTGCESASAVMLLRAAGYSTSIDTFIDDALDIDFLYYEDGVLYGPDPNKAFIGDPRSEYGYGCYAPVITNALNRILKESDRAVNITGMSLTQIIDDYIDKGIPAAIWATIAMIEPEWGTQWYIHGTDELFTWKSHEHCLVLVGYDSDYYYINDPYNSNGLVAYKRSMVDARFAAMGSQAVVVY